MSRTLSVIVLTILVTACGGGGSPTSPTPPPTPLPQPNIVSASEGVTFPPAGQCPGGECGYSFQARNAGQGCGRAVRGTVSLLNSASQVIASDEWALDASRMVRAGEQFPVEGCCLAEAAVAGTAQVRLAFAADTVACQ